MNLAKRFNDMPTLFADQKFIVLTSDHSSEIVIDFIEKEDFPSDIVVIDEDDYFDLGFVIDLDELYAYIVDQCGRLAFIVVPPWRYMRSMSLSQLLINQISVPHNILTSKPQ